MFVKNCPQCGKEQVYSSQRTLDVGIKNNTKCISCVSTVGFISAELKKCSMCGDIKDKSKFANGEAKCKKCRSEIDRARYIKNREKCKEYSKSWRAKNPEKSRAIVRRRRDRVRNIDATFTSEMEIEVMNKFENKCFNCGTSEKLEIDHHYPQILGNSLTVANAVVLCRSCNASKNAKHPEDFYSQKQLNVLKKMGVG